MTINKAAEATGSRSLGKLVQVKEVPYPELEDDMIIIKAVAYAVNPTDWKHIYPESFVSSVLAGSFRKLGLGISAFESPLAGAGAHIGCFVGKRLTFFQKGVVVGSDVSGIVEETGKKVTKVKKGDTVAASLHGGISKNGGFSNYVMVSENATIKFPPSWLLKDMLSTGKHSGSNINSFETAATVPVGLKTVALSFNYHLKIPPDINKNRNDYILIWGGATATGILAIQIAKLVYGIKVIATASKRNHDTLLSLGADKVFDYRDSDIVEKLRDSGEQKIKYAMDCVSSPETFQSVYDATEGSDNPSINNLLFLNEKSITTKPNRKVNITFTDAYLIDGRVHFGAKALDEMISSFLEFWDNYLPPILDKIKTTSLEVLPAGLQSANEGLRLLIENKVSGGKVVFRNSENQF